MRRISVIGTSGSGKTTMARALAARLRCPQMELDSVYHQPDWEPIPNDQFRERIARFMADNECWVIDGNYTSQGTADLVWPNADTIVWMDPPKPVVMAQIVPRSLNRVLSRRELWNGNRERWQNLFSTMPEKNIILWAWTTFSANRRRYEDLLDAHAWEHLEVRRIRSRSDARQLLTEAGRPA